MYTTCIFCQQGLGSNDALESFPVGERFAYDPSRGRLWVVCRRCARWNLTPLEERWEAIEEAERGFERARLRSASGEISLARLGDGTDLIRVGKPHRVELALWRYGDYFKRRRRQHLIVAGSVMAAGGLALAGAMSAGLGIFGAWHIGSRLYIGTREGAPWRTVAKVRTPKGNILHVRPVHLRRTQIGTTDDGLLRVKIGTARKGSVREGAGPEYTGDEARSVLAKLLPAVNRMGGSQHEIESAIARIEDAGSRDRFLGSLGRVAVDATPVVERSMWRWGFEWPEPGRTRRSGLFALPPQLSLAIEMATHEEQERIALEEDMSILEAAWREAEEIATIADNMFVPREVDDRLAEMKSKVGGGSP